MNEFENINNCRVCNNKVNEIIDFNDQPLANNFHKNDTPINSYPLKLMLCENCYHTQLSIVVKPKILFENYIYVSGTSQTLINYFHWFVNTVENITNIQSGSVLDIACNDCSLLNVFYDNGWDTHGVDPAKNIYKYTKLSNHNVICDYWNNITANKLNKTYNIIVAQNVFAHVNDIDGFLNSCKICMDNNSYLFIQTSQCYMFRNNEFDTVYHEHLSFFSIKSMKYILDKHNLYISNILFPDIHGTSYLFVISKNKNIENKEIISKYYNEESNLGQYSKTFYIGYMKHCYNVLETTKNFKNYYKDKHIIGFGAAAKSNTFLNFCKLDLEYIIDENPSKQGLYSPGMNIPIYSMKKLIEDKNDLCIIILAWNFKDEIIKKIKANRINKNDKYVVFNPKFQILS